MKVDREELNSNNTNKCDGFRFMVQQPDDIYSTFPFTLIPEKNFVFENGCLHHEDCLKKKYMVYNPSDANKKVNKVCSDLEYSPALKKILTNMNDALLYKQTIINKYLSHQQVEQRLAHHKDQEAKYRLKMHTQSKTIARLNKTMDLHQRLLHSIKDNKVHRLHDIVNVALRQGRSIGYIVEKVTDAIGGIYNPQYKEDDKDLAFLILQFGGPALLDIVHRACHLPSSSTAYKMIQGTRTINTPVNARISDLSQNIAFDANGPKYGTMLKIDEHFVDKGPRWCPPRITIYMAYVMSMLATNVYPWKLGMIS